MDLLEKEKVLIGEGRTQISGGKGEDDVLMR